ncbi:hypothetical protein A4X09_0g5948 [Tilletia walkeri]|uniref:RZ-type domain-containing protein n=1 Tax=Tilletia walkeri TaxID=117179 RepID=A0A8X7N3M7_9BASI|nr:hypothetical protein A4X09_0g5948 [Tilletia walkeri]
MRYGRPKKRACLDEQEKKHIDAANKTCKSLAERTAQLSVNVLAHVFGSHRSKKKMQGIKQHNLSHRGQKKLIHKLASDSMPTPASTFANLLHYGFSHASAVAWAESIEPVLSIILVAERMLKQKNPHVQAWQAAIAQAHQRFVATLDPRDIRRDQKALQLARASVSFPEPQAESKYHLLSMFIILDARMVMAKLASIIGDDLQPKQKEEWARLAEFLLSTGSQDAEKALRLAEATLHGKEALRAQAYGVRFRTEVIVNKLERSRAKETSKFDAAKIEEDAVKLEEKATSELERLREYWEKALSSATLGAAFQDQLNDIVSRRLADVEHFIKQRQARKAELKMIVETLIRFNVDFAYGGHFYRCPNGHVFTIGDCGGAMESGRCVECGATIGGTGHNLAEGNSRDYEMEQIARGLGAQPSPWAWGRD